MTPTPIPFQSMVTDWIGTPNSGNTSIDVLMYMTAVILMLLFIKYVFLFLSVALKIPDGLLNKK